MIAVFGLSQLLRRYDLTTPEAILYIRIMYYASQVLQVLFWLYVRYLIQKKGKKEKEKEKSTMIEVIEPAKPFSSEPAKTSRISVYDYDLSEVEKNLKQVLSGLAIMSVMQFWFKFTQPLIFQSLLPWKNFFTMPVIQIRLFGWKAEGSLARPWKVPNPFGDLMGQMSGDSTAGVAITSDNENENDKTSEVATENESGAGTGSESEVKASGVKSRKSRSRKEE
ncbi:hypothetical protein C9890_0109 [Perkinsus sp. BL_2016]|nr:hypothetical protein C9890_0109 [Perkinsus sp. BL_2016]